MKTKRVVGCTPLAAATPLVGGANRGVMMDRLMDRGGSMNAVERRRRLEALFTRHAVAVRAYAARRVPAAEIDDVTSDVFVVAWRRLDDLPDDALPWILGLCPTGRCQPEAEHSSASCSAGPSEPRAEGCVASHER